VEPTPTANYARVQTEPLAATWITAVMGSDGGLARGDEHGMFRDLSVAEEVGNAALASWRSLLDQWHD